MSKLFGNKNRQKALCGFCICVLHVFGAFDSVWSKKKIPALFILNPHRLQFSDHFTNTHICVRTN